MLGKKKLPADCKPGCEIGPLKPRQRARNAKKVRVEAADHRNDQGDFKDHPCNGDEKKYSDRNFCASYSKGLPHYETDHLPDIVAGEVRPDAYCKLLKALRSGEPKDFEDIPLGCMEEGGKGGTIQSAARFAPGGATEAAAAGAKEQLPLVNPQSALAFDLEGFDSHQLKIEPAPTFASAEEAGEMIELYWMALARDVHFSKYGMEPITKAAMADLNKFIANHPGKFEGPTEEVNGKREVTPKTLFRGKTREEPELVGPYLSQFLLVDVPFGAQAFDQKILTVQPGQDYMTTFAEWLEVQQGCQPPQAGMFDPTRRYIRNGRDLGQYVHIDVLFQAYFNAMLILLQTPSEANGGRGWNAPFDPNNPYPKGLNQEGFGTFGGPHIATLMCEVATRALKAVWYQKWSVHRRLRPEAFGARVEKLRTNPALKTRYDVHSALLGSDVLKAVQNGVPGTKLPKYGTHLLPMAFPEGSPLHPAYGAGHATVAGACVTVLKAWFDEKVKLSDLKNRAGMPLNIVPKEASADGLSFKDYTGPDAKDLTVGGELNKLAANIAIGRNHAGVHWRSDYDQSIRLGEQIAISVLEDQACTFNEAFPSGVQFSFTSFDGETVEIKSRPSCPSTRKA